MEDKEKILAQSMDGLTKTLASVKDRELLRDFLKALLTPQEYNAVASRWALVRLLDQGLTQRKISEVLGLSLCKITRGSREMKKDDSPFQKMIDICKGESSFFISRLPRVILQRLNPRASEIFL